MGPGVLPPASSFRSDRTLPQRNHLSIPPARFSIVIALSLSFTRGNFLTR
jgi:hypothetical protein